jgi:hypothetical protein
MPFVFVLFTIDCKRSAANTKRRGIVGLPVSLPSAMKHFARHPIEKYNRCTRRKDILYPLNPFLPKTLMTHHLQYHFMLNFIESLFKV